MRPAHPLFVVTFILACQNEEPGWREELPAPAEPKLVRQESAELSSDEILARWGKRAQTIGVFRCAEGTPFLQDPSDPHSIFTRFTVETHDAIKGDPPSSIVQDGGRLGDLEIESIHDGRIRVGESYLGFFRKDGGTWRLISAVKVVDGAFRVKGQSYTVASLQASVGGR